MNLCSCNHEEICYESRNCPLCEKINEVEDWEKENSAMSEKISVLESEIIELENAAADTSETAKT